MLEHTNQRCELADVYRSSAPLAGKASNPSRCLDTASWQACCVLALSRASMPKASSCKAGLRATSTSKQGWGHCLYCFPGPQAAFQPHLSATRSAQRSPPCHPTSLSRLTTDLHFISTSSKLLQNQQTQTTPSSTGAPQGLVQVRLYACKASLNRCACSCNDGSCLRCTSHSRVYRRSQFDHHEAE